MFVTKLLCVSGNAKLLSKKNRNWHHIAAVWRVVVYINGILQKKMVFFSRLLQANSCIVSFMSHNTDHSLINVR